MHEVSIAQAILRVAEETLGKVQPLLSARVTIGPLSGVEPETLSFCFPEVAEALGFGRPQLQITLTEIRARCQSCSTEYAMKDFGDSCPQCDSFDRILLSGDELRLEEVEVAEEEGDRYDRREANCHCARGSFEE